MEENLLKLSNIVLFKSIREDNAMTGHESYERLKQIENTVIPYEIKLMTNYEGWEDSIEMRGKNLKFTVSNVEASNDSFLKISDERGLCVSIPFEGVEIIDEIISESKVYIEVYFFVFDGFAKLTIVGREISITNSEKETKFNQIINEAKNCISCISMKDVEAVIGYANGNLDAGIMFVAEAPGPKGADISGIPLQGDVTGKNFDKLLASTKWTRSDVYITNAVLCCPTNEKGHVRSPKRQEVRNCSSYLARIIELINPKVIVPLGKKALESLKEIESHQLELKRDVATYTKWNNRYVYPLYHPSPQVINTGKRTFEQQRLDFRQLEHNYNKKILKGLEPINYRQKEED